uniref:Uncharacterized protein n=1 Tax=Anopheles farauti TaxID=69004 RepID=A0A182QQR9_9DIPT
MARVPREAFELIESNCVGKGCRIGSDPGRRERNLDDTKTSKYSVLGRRSIPAAALALALALAAASTTWHTFTLNVISRKVTSKVRENIVDGAEMNGLQSPTTVALGPPYLRPPPLPLRPPIPLSFSDGIMRAISMTMIEVVVVMAPLYGPVRCEQQDAAERGKQEKRTFNFPHT